VNNFSLSANMWIVPVSDEIARNLLRGEKAIEYIVAYSEPLRSSCIFSGGSYVIS